MCPENLRAFLEKYKKSKINLKFEDKNALHLLVSFFDNSSKRSEFPKIAECIKIMLDNGCDPNMPDDDFKTPFFMLLNAKSRLDADMYKDLVNYFLEHSKVDVYTYKSEEMISMLKMLRLPIPSKIEKVVNVDYLRNLIDNGCVSEFIENFEEFKDRYAYGQEDSATSDKEDTAMLLKNHSKSKDYDNLSEDYKESCAIFLVEATKNGMTRIVDFLLKQGIDINRFPKSDQPAAFLACSRGYHEILELFLNHTNSENSFDLEMKFKDRNLLHEVCRHFGFSEATEDDQNQNYQKCFDLLISCAEIDVNQQDGLGFTPLYYAIRYKNDEATKALLRRCYVGNKNVFNKAQIYHIRKDIFEEFLDECISVGVDEGTGEQKVTVDFSFLVAPKEKGRDFFEEIAPLEEIANNAELRPLILHPVLSSFLYLKWIKLSILFYTNLLFFLFFMGSFITYIVLYKSDAFFYMSLVSLIIMMVKEVIQYGLSYKTYFKSPMNWFELALMFLIWVVLIDNQFKTAHDELVQLLGLQTLRVIRGVTILCCTYEILVLFGDLPSFSVSTHMVILKRVFITFLKSIALYSILLVGFAFCFYTLFGHNEEESTKSGTNETKGDDDEDFHHFKYPGFAIIKTIVMFSGELEASSLNLKNNDAFYSIIFLLFVFLITIVLLNLINGLTVADVFQIKAEGHLVDLCQKIHVLNKYEGIIMSRPDACRFLKSIISIFPVFVQEGKIDIDGNSKVKLCSSPAVNESVMENIYNSCLRSVIKFDGILKSASKMELEDKQKSKPKEFTIKIEGKIMKRIKTVLEQRDDKVDVSEQQGRMKSIEAKLKLLPKLEKKLEYILDLLESERS